MGKVQLTWCCVYLTLLAASQTEGRPNEIPASKEAEGGSDPPDFRLPDALSPIHYLVRLQPFLSGNFSIEGYTEITLEVLKPTDRIVLHIKDIITKNDTLKVYDATDSLKTSLAVLNQTFDEEKEFYAITLAEALKQDSRYVVQLEFQAYLNEKLAGFYRSSYKGIDGKERTLAVTQFQPTAARSAFPCFDEPALKAEFSIELLREEGYSAISNMPLAETTPVKGLDGWFVNRFEKSVKMSTYLVAFLISDFEYVTTTTATGTTLRVWAREESINQTAYALRIGKEALEFFEGYFNISFPLPKTDMIAIPDFSAGAMENWGLITYRETALLYDEERSSLSSKLSIGSVIVHELAHQWFGNLVTPYWWTDLWLNEGFATYMASVGYDAVEPSLKIKERFASGILRSAMSADAFENSHPISIEVGHPDEISEIFDAISYSKGASVIRMMSEFLTEETFKKGVTNYLNKFAYSDAKQDDLWHYLTLQAEQDGTLPRNVTVKQIMDTWTLQMNYPVINVTRRSNGTALLTQERFLISKGNNTDNDAEYRWWVPLTFTSQSDPDFSNTRPQEWMMPSESRKTISGMPPAEDWVIFNNLQTGIYRVNYELDNWEKLTKQLAEDPTVINPSNRIQIVGDAFSLAKAGLISYTIPLNLIPYVIKENNVNAFRTANGELSRLVNRLKFTELFDATKKFYLSLMASHYNEVGFKEIPGESVFTQERRRSIVHTVCYYDYKPCLETANKLYQEWMLNPNDESLLSPNLRKAVYCYGIKEGGNKEWDFAWNQYLQTDLVSKKIDLLRSLGCTRNLTTKAEIMKRAFEPNSQIRKQNAITAFASVIRDKESSLLAWKYVTENWDSIYDYITKKSRMIRLINLASSHIRTYEALEKRDQFISEKPRLQNFGIRNLLKKREKLVSKIEWLAKNRPVVDQWLAGKGFKTGNETASEAAL